MSDTTLPEGDILSILDSFNEDTFGASILAGTNLKIDTDGSPCYFEVDKAMFYFKTPAAALIRATLRSQGEMLVLTTTIGTQGEEIGRVSTGEDNAQKFTPELPYRSASFASWRSWVHLMNTEFMRPNPETIEAIKDMLTKAGWVTYQPRQAGPTRDEAERKSQIIFDLEPKGNTVLDRFSNGLKLSQFVILPEERHQPGVTQFTRRDGAIPETRPGFTSFSDILTLNLVNLAKAVEGTDRTAIRAAMSRLSLLTGVNESYSLRPTLGYLTPMGADGKPGEQLDLFPPRTSATEELSAELASEGIAPAEPANQGEEPF